MRQWTPSARASARPSEGTTSRGAPGAPREGPVCNGLLGLEDFDLHRSAIAGIAVRELVLGAVRQPDEDVHLGPKLDVVARLGHGQEDLPAVLLAVVLVVHEHV